jgi:Sec-independent protein translocase protein TatA
VRTVLAWVNRFRRSFDQIRTEVRRELHNDEIMQKLKAESQEIEQQVRDTTQSVERELQALETEEALAANPDAIAIASAPPANGATQIGEQANPEPEPDTNSTDAPTQSA